MKEKDPDRLSFSWVKYSHKNRNYHLPCVHAIKYNRKHTLSMSILSGDECSRPGVSSVTGEWVQLMGSTCNSLPLATPQPAFIHRQHKGFHAELLGLDLLAGWAGAGGLSHCSCLIVITRDQTEGQLMLSHCHCGKVPQSTKQGEEEMERCCAGPAVWCLPCAEPIRDVAWQLVASRLLEDFLLCRLASREINPVPPFLLGNALAACLSLLQGTWG